MANLKDVIHGSKRHLPDRPLVAAPDPSAAASSTTPMLMRSSLGASDCERRPGWARAWVRVRWHVDPRDSGLLLQPFISEQLDDYSPQEKLFNPRQKGRGCRHVREQGTGHKQQGFAGRGRQWDIGHYLSQVWGSVQQNGCGRGTQVTNLSIGFSDTRWHEPRFILLIANVVENGAVTELAEGDSSRKIVEIICRTGLTKSKMQCRRIDKVLKVHNMQKTLARFKEYSETVKIQASKLPKKHPHCLADGNELLRFYGATVSCSFGVSGGSASSSSSASSLCLSERCQVCRIIREGFSAKREMREGVGVFTTSTSGRAIESIDAWEEENADPGATMRKALIVCRVIAGRVHRPIENIQEMAGQTRFDSLAAKVRLYSHIDDDLSFLGRLMDVPDSKLKSPPVRDKRLRRFPYVIPH
ncbi:hypothetical protein MLD38_034129 [Melastoma candidum]|uniref:Uncharacterized protein n=1 Tax=Melastoma candidum TaxID=119954 RepID=A0ACB9MD90_9MYRT|nr:hypothetical protein MLD38_034129 [Melastoma candidum]